MVWLPLFLPQALKSAGTVQVLQRVSDPKKKTHLDVPRVRLSLGNFTNPPSIIALACQQAIPKLTTKSRVPLSCKHTSHKFLSWPSLQPTTLLPSSPAPPPQLMEKSRSPTVTNRRQQVGIVYDYFIVHLHFFLEIFEHIQK